MSLKTRLDSQSADNNILNIHNADGEVVARIKIVGGGSAQVEVDTFPSHHISKNNGWSSKR